MTFVSFTYLNAVDLIQPKYNSRRYMTIGQFNCCNVV